MLHAETSHRPTVLVADDHAPMVERLVAILEARFTVVGAVADGERLIDEAVRLRPDVVVTDISMPGLNGLEAVCRLRRSLPETRIVVVTMHAEEAITDAARSAGAAAVVLKLLVSDQLIPAIDNALATGKC
jgi:DNA-binding NarL/FixJ family response regulator